MKKGAIEFETIGKLILGIVLLLAVILIIWYIKTKLYGGDNTIVSNLAQIFRFGK